MEVSVRVHRILRHLTAYVTLVSDMDLEGIIPLQDETLLGVYQNDVSNLRMNVVVSDIGLRWWADGKVLFVKYADIEKSEVLGEKTTADSIRIQTRAGVDHILRIEGGSGKLREVWEVKRFITRVVGDIHKA